MFFKLQIVYHLIGFKLAKKKLYSKKGLSKLKARYRKRWEKNLKKSPLYNSLKEFPVIDKTFFMENFDQINTASIKKEKAFKVAIDAEKNRDFSPEVNNITIGLSSGTSGNKGIFLASKKEKAIWVAAILDRVIGFKLKKRKVAFFLRANSNLYESVNSSILSFNFFDLMQSNQQNFKKLHDLNPHILVGQPSVLIEIAKYYKQNRLIHNFSKIISVAEVLEDDQRAYIEDVFQIKLDQVYQCTEGFLAHTCKNGTLHFNEWIEIEKKYIDHKKDRFHPIITDYFRRTQPIIRYELNDIIHEQKPSCDCGLKTISIKKIEGRSDDIFTFGEVTIYPDFIRRAVIMSSDNIINFQVKKHPDNKIGIYFDIEAGNHQEVYNKVVENLKNMLKKHKVSDNVQFFYQEYQHNPINKFKRICNEDKI